jgi:hypothetical protein
VPTIYKDQLLGLVRHLLTFGGGLLVKAGYAPDGSISPELVAGLASLLVGMGFSAYQKVTAGRVRGVALNAAGITEAQVKAKIASGATIPTVLTGPNEIPSPTQVRP